MRHQHLGLRHEHVLEQQRARHRSAHAERIPVAHDLHAGRISGNGEIERVAPAGGGGLRAFGAQHAVVVRGARERGENLLAVDDEAALDGARLGAERHRAGRGGAALRERLRIDGAIDNNATIVQAATRVVSGAVLRAHRQVVGERTRPQGRAHVHVPGQRGRAAVAAELGRGDAIGLEIRAAAPVGLRDADREQALAAHIAKVLDRKRRVAIMLRGARRQHAFAEPARLVDQIRLRIGQPERVGCEHRSIVIRIGRMGHRTTSAQARAADCVSRRSARTAALKAAGVSTFGRWPAPGRHT